MGPLDFKGLRVLVIDDNVNTVRLVADVLRASGVGKVNMAYGGVMGLNSLQPCRPDIIFVDWQMPDMDGLAFTRTLRRAAIQPNSAVHDPRVPVIMLTGRKSERDVELARKAGVNEFVAKPFTPAGLLGRIQMVLTRPREFVINSEYVGPDRRRRMEVSYSGPLRREDDAQIVVESVERQVTRRTIGVELEALRGLTQVRGGSDRATLQMSYRAMKHNVHRARAVRDVAIEQASNSLVRYIDAMGGPTKAEPKVVEVHMDAISTLLSLADGDETNARLVNSQLERVVQRKIDNLRANAA